MAGQTFCWTRLEFSNTSWSTLCNPSILKSPELRSILQMRRSMRPVSNHSEKFYLNNVEGRGVVVLTCCGSRSRTLGILLSLVLPMESWTRLNNTAWHKATDPSEPSSIHEPKR
jgi:hypothetical protein